MTTVTSPLVTKDKPFWTHGLDYHNPVLVERVHLLPNHTLCGFLDGPHRYGDEAYALDHEKTAWQGIGSAAGNSWCYHPVVDWLCYPGTPEYDRIMTAAFAGSLVEGNNFVAKAVTEIAREHGY